MKQVLKKVLSLLSVLFLVGIPCISRAAIFRIIHIMGKQNFRSTPGSAERGRGQRQDSGISLVSRYRSGSRRYRCSESDRSNARDDWRRDPLSRSVGFAGALARSGRTEYRRTAKPT